MLLKIKDRLLYIKSFLLGLIVIIIFISLFYFKIPRVINLEGVAKCNKKECTYTVIVTSSIEKYLDDFKEITFKKTEKINKVVLNEPYVLNNVLVNELVIYVSNQELKNNQVVKSTITVSEDTIISLFLKSLKGGDEDA